MGTGFNLNIKGKLIMKKIIAKTMVLSALLISGNAYSGVVQINSQVAFDALGTVTQNTNFDSYSAGFTSLSGPLTVGDLTFAAGSGGHLIGGDQYGFSRQNFTDNNVQGVTIDIANSYNMLAVAAGNYFSSGQGIFNVVTDLSTYSFTVDLLNTTYGFFGFQATDGEHIISFNNGRDLNFLATGFTDIQLGNTAAVNAVPVPAAVWLFGSALTGLFGFGKRKQAKILTA
jgi:hypothetical protein